MSEAETIQVEVAYALPEKQAIVPVSVAPGTTALEAVQQSAIADQFEQLEISDRIKLGIFGKAVPLGQVLREGDRVEIYRPLHADPKEVRKARAAAAKERRAQAGQGN